MAKEVARGLEVLTVRFPVGLLDVMREKAVRGDRSLNAEIVRAIRYWTKVEEQEEYVFVGSQSD